MRRIGVVFLLWGVMDLSGPRCSLAESPPPTLAAFCQQQFQSTGECPAELCNWSCPPDAEGEVCQPQCLPKPCPHIAVQNCPLDYCVIMENCSHEKVCHFPMPGEKALCGDLAYAGQDVACCEGLVKRCGYQFLDGSCDMKGRNSMYNLPICIPCGDGICGQFEDRCNCPEDCAPQPPPPNYRLTPAPPSGKGASSHSASP